VDAAVSGGRAWPLPVNPEEKQIDRLLKWILTDD
jgi:hypothetical protein